jgi:hypothetical protein
VGSEYSNPLDELRNLDAQVDSIDDLAALKPVFYRLDEIAKQQADNFEVQLVVGEIKQHLVNRGTKLKQMKEAGPPPLGAPTGPTAGPPPLMGSTGGLPVPPPPPLDSPIDLPPPKKLMSSGQFAQKPDEPAAMPPPVPPPPQTIPYGESPLGAFPPTPPPMPPTPPKPPSGVWSPPADLPGASEPPQLPTSEASPPAMFPPNLASDGPAGAGFGSEQMPPPQPPEGTGAGAPPPSGSWQKPLWLGAVIGLVIVLAAGGLLWRMVRNRNGGGTSTAVNVDIATTPPGAAIRINGENKCTSNCQVPLEPGDYQVTAFLDGYDAAAGAVTVKAGQPTQVNLTLEPQGQTVRVLTDLDQGKVAFDDQAPVDLQEGQFLLERVAPGQHSLKVTGRGGEVSLSFELAVAKMPVLTAPMTARSMFAVAVTTFANQGKVITGSGPMKLAVNGQPEADATPAGVDLRSFQPGISELVLGEGPEQRNVKENFGPAPTLTVFTKSDQNIGTLIVATGNENDVRVFLNNREYPRKTQRGEVRIRTIGKVSVRVAKEGYESPPAQIAEVQKGGEVRLEFPMKIAAQFGTLQVMGGTPGADVLVDGRIVGAVGVDGNFSHSSVLPGDHAIEIRRDQFNPKHFDRSFKAGQTILIAPPDSVLVSNRPPPPTPVPEPPKITPAPPKPVPPPPAPPKVYTMNDFEQPSAWRMMDGVFTHKGAATLLFGPPPRGLVDFTVHLLKGGNVFRGGRVRWVVDYTDSKNYAYFELDDDNFWTKDVVNGKAKERTKTNHKQKDKIWTIEIDISPDRVYHKMMINGQWMQIDDWKAPGRDFTDGKFGFLIQGDDEVGVSGFKFTAAK